MARGLCKICGEELGGIFQPTGWRCVKCGYVYCYNCCPKVGFIFKKPACPKCGIELTKKNKRRYRS